MSTTSDLICTACYERLDNTGAVLRCRRCDRSFEVADGVADFSEGHYYDQFCPGQMVAAEHLRGLALEEEGTRWRMERYYLPLLARDFGSANLRVLDSGCGNGVGVDFLIDRGVDAWGNDLSQLRRWQWNAREHRDRLVVANSMRLPFPNAFFDAVITSGVIEHIGVDETSQPRYSVMPRATRDAERGQYLAELLRVTKPGGAIYVDCPNGLFPIDFWHSSNAGGARFHRRSEGFLPTPNEIRSLVRHVDPAARCTPLNPEHRFRFEQVGGHWYGRLFRPAIALLFRSMRWVKPLRASVLNPYLVMRITR